jgi:hypothetical protein
MATFRLGQRVKKVCQPPPSAPWSIIYPMGAEGQIVEKIFKWKGFLRWGYVYRVMYDGYNEAAWALPHMIAPLTDNPQKSTSWAEDKVKELTNKPLAPNLQEEKY